MRGLTLIFFAAVVAFAGCVQAPEAPLAPIDVQRMPGKGKSSRVGEPVRYADLQVRIDRLRDRGGCPHDRWVARAQWWLAFSRDEWHDQERGPVIGETTEQSLRIVEALEQNRTPSDYRPA